MVKIPKLTQEQRFVILSLLEREFYRKSVKCLKMNMREIEVDRLCCIGLYEFICNKFVMMDNKEFDKIRKKHNKNHKQ